MGIHHADPRPTQWPQPRAVKNGRDQNGKDQCEGDISQLGAFCKGATKFESALKSGNWLGDGYHDPATEQT